jgi:hypothetical protein
MLQMIRFLQSPKLHVTKVKVKDGTEFGRHFCSEVHAVEVTGKSFLEALILATTNPQYDKRLLINLPVQPDFFGCQQDFLVV